MWVSMKKSSDMFQPIISNLQSLGLLYKSYCLFLLFVYLFLSYLSEHNVCSQYVLLPRPCFGFRRDETITFLSYDQLLIACKVLAEISNFSDYLTYNSCSPSCSLWWLNKMAIPVSGLILKMIFSFSAQYFPFSSYESK